jgi:hypothetical protein
MIRMLERSRTEKFLDRVSKHIAYSLIATLLVFAAMVALQPNAHRYQLFLNCILTIESCWIYGYSEPRIKKLLKDQNYNRSERQTKFLFAIQSGIAFTPGIIVPLCGFYVTINEKNPILIVINFLALLLLVLVVASIAILIPINQKPALKCNLLARLPYNRKQLDSILRILLLSKPESIQTINAYLRSGEPFRAIQHIVSHTEASYNQARTLLPRIAAQDLRQLFPEKQ